MSADYPEHLLAREPAPPYAGEGPFALWHFSEDRSLGRFLPHTPATNPQAPPLVWAVDTRHAPMFWFPRECPRGCIWPASKTTAEDRERAGWATPRPTRTGSADGATPGPGR